MQSPRRTPSLCLTSRITCRASRAAAYSRPLMALESSTLCPFGKPTGRRLPSHPRLADTNLSKCHLVWSTLPQHTLELVAKALCITSHRRKSCATWTTPRYIPPTPGVTSGSFGSFLPPSERPGFKSPRRKPSCSRITSSTLRHEVSVQGITIPLGVHLVHQGVAHPEHPQDLTGVPGKYVVTTGGSLPITPPFLHRWTNTPNKINTRESLTSTRTPLQSKPSGS